MNINALNCRQGVSPLQSDCLSAHPGRPLVQRIQTILPAQNACQTEPGQLQDGRDRCHWLRRFEEQPVFRVSHKHFSLEKFTQNSDSLQKEDVELRSAGRGARDAKCEDTDLAVGEQIEGAEQTHSVGNPCAGWVDAKSRLGIFQPPILIIFSLVPLLSIITPN